MIEIKYLHICDFWSDHFILVIHKLQLIVVGLELAFMDTSD